MTHVLYRKYRPQTFSQLVNQRAVVQTLTNTLKAGQVAHAYLFTGPRGTGKTTTARLLAKAVNCSKPKGFEPCNECDVCLEINRGKALDVVEIDAASNRGIDDVRRLREEIRFGPQRLKQKVFILDEAHMLTREAANALLKSLEEPPSHTIFILATTEPQKMLATIISRCQRLDFHTFSLHDIIERLAFIAKAEKLKVDERALRAMAVNAKGALRDAESILGKVLSLAGAKAITFDEVRSILGIVDQHLAVKLTGFLAKKATKEALAFIASSVQSGVNSREFLKTFIEYLRKLALVRADEALLAQFKDEFTQEEAALLAKQAKEFALADILRALDICLEELGVIEYYPLEQMALEVAIMKYLVKE